MLLEQKTEKIIFSRQDAQYVFLPTGDVFEFLSGNFMINQFQGNPVDGSVNNIYLRVYDGDACHVTPLLGRKSNSQLLIAEDSQLVYKGETKGIEYQVSFLPADNGIWFWKIDLKGNGNMVDLVYGQDVGVGDKGGIITNELYISQYLDHCILKGEHGNVICSRQNQSQGGNFPYLQQGSLTTDLVGFSTDGMQFFGKSSKDTGIPEALYSDLQNINYQYELSYTALQTEKMVIEGNKTIVFYGLFCKNHEDAVKEVEFTEEIKAAYAEIEKKLESNLKPLPAIDLSKEIGRPFSSGQFTEDEINEYFPDRILEEKENNVLLSFFTKDHRHVVCKEKELLVERPHGNIITTLVKEDTIRKDLITSTHYMYGFFNGQITIGNTNMNKLISVNRGLLNLQKNTGQRIYVKIDGTFRILTLPAIFEIGLNYSRWFYKIGTDILTITSFATAETTDIVLTIQSKEKKAYEYLITNQIVMGNHEFQEKIVMEKEGNCYQLTPIEGSNLANTYPELSYQMELSGASFSCTDDKVFYQDNKTRNGSLLVFCTQGSDIRFSIHGNLEEKTKAAAVEVTAEDEYKKYLSFYKNFLADFSLDASFVKEKKEEIEKLNEAVWWYTHNALVHFAVPHGLEQSGGAAWGTRDVCQGPMEFFLATGHISLAREVLKTIFAHQFDESGEWPQWFMFDRYPYYADDCHGDVVFWPLKAIGDYLRVTKDVSILQEVIPYISNKRVPETMIHHIKHAVEAINQRFLYDTALISYAGGDWDDTLQPANKAMKEKLVSAWTQALAFQTLGLLSDQLKESEQIFAQELLQLSEKIGSDFTKYLVKDGVIAGFAYLESKDEIRYMLHPDDDQTGIHYRLLPLTRSIISSLTDKSQAEINLELIDKHLACTDGIRLMDRPARYEGGISRFFQRAEQASNVGREISLQYVHAHIRYVEAMAKFGAADKAWKGLFQILPIKIKDAVPNAQLRQSNSYFSSSEGAFNTRYEYQEHFDRLRNGNIAVKGGWRIYSSGPGIYMAGLITGILGIRLNADGIGIDPVLPKSADGLLYSCTLHSHLITFEYRANKEEGQGIRLFCQDKEIIGERMDNPYRTGGVWIDQNTLEQIVKSGGKITVCY